MPTAPPDTSDVTALRPVLLGHCYRMLGSPIDADDAVQETLIRAVNGLPGFHGTSSLKTWTLRIATNVCLDEIARRKRRIRPMALPVGTPAGPFEPTPSEDWVEPIPDAWVTDGIDAPEEVAAARQSVRLALVAAVQFLPARQRAALLLTEVMGLSATEAAVALDSSVASVNSAVQRARSAVQHRISGPDEVSASPESVVTAQRYADAFLRYDVDRIVSLLAHDVTFDMPPIPLWLRGPQHVAEFLRGPGAECQGSVLVPVRANGAPAFAQYRDGGRTPWGLVVLRCTAEHVTGVTTFLGVDDLFPLFGLPPHTHSSPPTDEFASFWQSNG